MHSRRRLRAVLAAGAALSMSVSGCAAATRGRAHSVAPPVSSVNSPPTGRSAVPSGVAPAKPVRTPCTGNRLRKYVYVDLRRQHMWMCARHAIAYETAMTSGMAGVYTHTPTGSYHVQGLNRNTTLTLNTGATYPVKYWIPFDAPLFGFHDSSWQHFPYGSPKYKTRGSHGCVHMPLKAIRFLYHWADVGTLVRIKA
jgi:hypothetical protein